MKQRISRVSAKNDEDRILGGRTDLDGSGSRIECLAEQEAYKLKPGTWTEIRQVKNGEELPRNREQHLWEAWIRRSFVLLRKNQSILNKAKASISRLSSNSLSSGEPSLTPLCSHRTWDILPLCTVMSVSLVYAIQMPVRAPLSLRSSFCYSTSIYWASTMCWIL